MSIANPTQLTPREMAVLAHVVDAYVQTAEPVGSHVIARRLHGSATTLAPATVRGIMADLEGAGLLTHPHTSAGRIPTTLGLRLYLDCLIAYEPITPEQRAQLDPAGCDNTLSLVLQQTSKTLAQLSRYCGIVVVPSRQELTFRHFEFVPLSERRLLGIFVTREGETVNRVIEVAVTVSPSLLEQINNYCNTAFVGLTLAQARTKAEQTCAQLEHEVADCAQQAMQLASAVLGAAPEPALAIEGTSRLLEYPEFAEAGRLQPLLSALDEQRQIAQLLVSAETGPAVRVFLGAECGYDALQECGIVVAPYHRQGQMVGTLGVIGPTRMAYGRVIPIVQCAAEQVSHWLEEES